MDGEEGGVKMPIVDEKDPRCSGIPWLIALPSDRENKWGETYIEVWCPYCHCYHEHGAPFEDIGRERVTTRTPHCPDQDNFPYEYGVYIPTREEMVKIVDGIRNYFRKMNWKFPGE